MTQPLITLTNVVKGFPFKSVLKGLSITIYRDEVTAIIGRNGSGKSTLLRVISGLGAIDRGKREEFLLGRTIRVGFTPDRFPKLRYTAFEYLRSMGRMQGIEEKVLRKRIDHLFEAFRFDPATKQQIRYFSKGMLQKVNLMQAMLTPPDLLLLDEPLSGLDIQTQEELMNVLVRLKSQGLSIIMSTHEPELVQRLADRVITLDDGVIASDSYLTNKPTPAQYKVIIQVNAENREAILSGIQEAGGKIESVTRSSAGEGDR
jgi:ABC-2 type transport system ATP-binding protein